MRSSSWLYLCPTRMNRCLEDEVVRLKSGRRPRHRSTRRSQRQHAHRRSQQYSGEAAGSPPAPYRIEHCQCSRVHHQSDGLMPNQPNATTDARQRCCPRIFRVATLSPPGTSASHTTTSSTFTSNMTRLDTVQWNDWV